MHQVLSVPATFVSLTDLNSDSGKLAKCGYTVLGFCQRASRSHICSADNSLAAKRQNFFFFRAHRRARRSRRDVISSDMFEWSSETEGVKRGASLM